MSDTPISDSTPHNVAELGMLCRRLERELTASNSIIRQQQLLDEENLRLQERIKRLEKWIACLNPIAQHSGQSENREWHGVDIRWLYPSQVVYLGEAKP
jgi:hypothetical protein